MAMAEMILHAEAQAPPAAPQRRWGWGIAFSVILHLLLVLALLFWHPATPPRQQEAPAPIPVEVVMEEPPPPPPAPQPAPRQREELDQATRYAENPKAGNADQISRALQEKDAAKTARRASEAVPFPGPAAARPEEEEAQAVIASTTSAQGSQIGGRLGALIRAQLTPCWSYYGQNWRGVADIGQLRLYVEAELDPNGALVRPPIVAGQGGVTVRNEVVVAAVAEGARKAIAECAPYRFPDEIYNEWRRLKLVFLLEPGRR